MTDVDELVFGTGSEMHFEMEDGIIVWITI
jgi:hypothetical protein